MAAMYDNAINGRLPPPDPAMEHAMAETRKLKARIRELEAENASLSRCYRALQNLERDYPEQEKRIVKLEALLDECKSTFILMTQEGCGCCDVHALRMIDKLRA